MAADFGKLLDQIQTNNDQLKISYGRLGRAYEKLDGRLTRLGARARVEPYAIDKKSERKIGYRRFEHGWSITTMVQGVAGLEAEVPVSETSPHVQAELMPHVAPLLEKISALIADDVKNAKKAVTEAEKLLAALP